MAVNRFRCDRRFTRLIRIVGREGFFRAAHPVGLTAGDLPEILNI
jgi:hypothetical protein